MKDCLEMRLWRIRTGPHPHPTAHQNIMSGRSGGSAGRYGNLKCALSRISRQTLRCSRIAWILALLPLSPAQARDSLGMFENWGAFRDSATPRCYAIAQALPTRGSRDGSKGFAAVATWPRVKVRGQVHFRLSRPHASAAPVILNVDDRRFTLVAGQADAWAADARGDAAIVAAIRSGSSMSVQTRASDGRGFADTYALRGAATAIDAAALGCARLR